MHIKNPYFLDLKKLEEKSLLFWKEIYPSRVSCVHLKKYLESHAAVGNWDCVVDLSSKALLHLNEPHQKPEFYYFWICALAEMFDNTALVFLGRHLARIRHEHKDFLALAFIAFAFANCKNTCNLLFNKLAFKNHECHIYYEEALALYHIMNSNPHSKSKAFSLYKSVFNHKKSNYLVYRNYIRFLSEHHDEVQLSHAYKTLNKNFYFAPEPYFVAASISMQENKFEEAVSSLKSMLEIIPQSQEGKMALSFCYEKLGKIDEALDLLVSCHGNECAEYDFDRHYGIARMLSIKFKLVGYLELKEQALKHYNRSLRILSALSRDQKYILKEIEALILYRKCDNVEKNEECGVLMYSPGNQETSSFLVTKAS